LSGHLLCHCYCSENQISAATWIRIWRDREGLVFHAPIDEREAEALKRMMGGESFAEICDAYSDLSESAAAQESIATLALWLECGLIAGVE
jgi:hypothetical protein